MSAAELDGETIEQLEPLTAQPHLGILLGAGASAAAGLPGWNELASRLLTQSGAVPEEDTANAFLSSQDPALAAEAARAASSDWLRLVGDALYGDERQLPEPAVLHLAAASLAVDRSPDEIRLFTLNFDPLLEGALRRALAERGEQTSVVARAVSSPRAPAGTYEVHHLHGVVTPEGPGTDGVVLTLQDFVDLGQQNAPWQVGALQEALQRGPLVLAGTSYRDPDIRQWLHDLSHDQPVVVLLAREGLGLSREQYAAIRPALIAQWQALGVQAVPLQDHADAAQALRELPHVGKSDYLNPLQRARDLWERHLERFEQRQQDHAHQLEADVGRLRVHLGAEANLTLWLANGAGQLVRWASNDRTYLAPEQLRLITPGHDSPWIAARCLGRDDTVAVDLPLTPGGTARWRSVVAAPVMVPRPGGPALSCAALSSAATQPFDSYDVDAWHATLTELAEEWADRLRDV